MSVLCDICYSLVLSTQGYGVLEIHSRKSQSHRNRISERFRNGRGLVMFTSDVSARGMDYPDVSAVIQARKYGLGGEGGLEVIRVSVFSNRRSTL